MDDLRRKKLKSKVEKLKPGVEVDIIILRHLVAGKTAKEIGQAICMSPRTVEYRVYTIMRILDCRNHAHLAATVVRKKIVE